MALHLSNLLQRGFNGAVLLVLVTMLGCNRGPVSTQLLEEEGDTAVVASRPVTTADGKGTIYRLSQDLLARRQQQQREPLVLPLESMRVSLGMKDRNVQPAELAKYIKKDNESIRLAAGDSFSSVELNLPFRADHYNAFEVTMKADQGSRCSLSWSSDLEPSVVRNEGVGTPIFPDGELHSYRISLDPYVAETWAGTIDSIAFYPSNEAANVEILELKFMYVPPEAPARVSLNTQTHEALFGTLPPWQLTVPPGGTLDLHIGMLPRAWSEDRHGKALFQVTVDTAQQKGIPLVSQELDPAEMEPHREWIPFISDLSAYAGQKVQLNFTVDHLGPTEADYAFWGDPLVFSNTQETDAIPVILIVCDTLRADHLSCYGYLRETTPHLDAFAQEAVLFENTICQETWTLPSHATIFTGLYPKNHGVTANANLPESTITLTEALRNAGYLSAGYTGFTFWLYPWRGFAHGFDLYNIPEWRTRPVYETRAFLDGWLDNHPVPNVFIFFHNFDVHAKPAKQYDGLPYGPDDPSFLHFAKEFESPPTFERPNRKKVDGEAFMLAANEGKVTLTPEEVAYCIALYDDCTRMVDQNIFEFFEKLKALELYDQALIIVTADHGEEFGEHGAYGHGNVYEQSAHVPLLIRFPNAQYGGTRYPHVVQLTDLYPTVLSVLGLPLPGPVDGQDLFALVNEGTTPQGTAYTQRQYWKAVRNDDWKLIRNERADRYEMYDMRLDRAEMNNVYADAPVPLPDMQEDLLAFYQVNPEGWHFAYSSPDPEWLGELEVTADSALDTAVLAKGRDRQNMITRGRSVLVKMGRGGDDELILSTTDPATKLVVTASSEVEFTLAVGNRKPEPDRSFTLALDPSEGPFQPPTLDTNGKNVLRVWYVEPKAKRSAAKALSQDIVDELRALGYAGD